LVFDENWEYQKNISFANNSLAYAIEIENELYITGNHAVYKTDKSLNIINAFYNTGLSTYRGIYYNKTSDLIYVADFTTYYCISVFNRNLTFIESINIGYKPYGLADYDEKLFVGTMNGTILVIQNKIVIKTFSTICNAISSLLIDNDGYMIIACYSPNAAYIYHTNGTNTGKQIKTGGVPMFINFDSKGRLIISSTSRINIYY
jgi:DNA-binding beta-propeller fold protein YncE